MRVGAIIRREFQHVMVTDYTAGVVRHRREVHECLTQYVGPIGCPDCGRSLELLRQTDTTTENVYHVVKRAMNQNGGRLPIRPYLARNASWLSVHDINAHRVAHVDAWHRCFGDCYALCDDCRIALHEEPDGRFVKISFDNQQSSIGNHQSKETP